MAPAHTDLIGRDIENKIRVYAGDKSRKRPRAHAPASIKGTLRARAEFQMRRFLALFVSCVCCRPNLRAAHPRAHPLPIARLFIRCTMAYGPMI